MSMDGRSSCSNHTPHTKYNTMPQGPTIKTQHRQAEATSQNDSLIQRVQASQSCAQLLVLRNELQGSN